MKEKNYFWIFGILFLAVGLAIGFSLTGNVVRVKESTASASNVASEGGANNVKIGTYFDPMSCYPKDVPIGQYNSWEGWADCNNVNGKQGFVGALGFLFCTPGSRPELVGYMYFTIGSMPTGVGYTCTDQNGIWSAPLSMQVFCCEMKGVTSSPITNTAKKTSRIDKVTKQVVTT